MADTEQVNTISRASARAAAHAEAYPDDRIILHCDMNNFYASVECLNNPTLRGKCVAVCGSQEDRHGIVLAKNYAAKAFGVTTGETIWQAKLKCPDLTIVPPHYSEYMKYSQIAHEIYSDFTDRIESYGMDECWLDITPINHDINHMEYGEKIAGQIRERIRNETGLTISVGVSWNKIFAKLGSDMKKPDATTVISRENYKDKIYNLEASDLLGVGRATKKVLNTFGIYTIADLAASDEMFMRLKFGKIGLLLKAYALGLDSSEVKKYEYTQAIKSVGHGTTALHDLNEYSELWPVILHLSQDIGTRLREINRAARGIAIDVKDNTLFSKEWQCRLDRCTMNSYEIAKAAYRLFCSKYTFARPVRAFTVRAIDLTEDLTYQLDVFFENDNILKQEKLDSTVDAIRRAYGPDAIKCASLCSKIPVAGDTDCEIIMPSGMVM